SMLTLLGMAAISFHFYDTLPPTIATKFDFSGEPTQYSSKEFVVIFLPMVFAGLIVLINALVKISPHKFSMPNSKKTMDTIVFGTGLLLLGIHIGMVTDPGGQVTFAKYFSWGMALFLIVVGNVFGKTERNFFMGIRVPWTLSTEANWKATHRFAGKLMVTFGVLLMAVTFFYSTVGFAVAFILLPTLVPVYYSYRYYKLYEKGKEPIEA
ncbi:MAG: SdpI family protein, partial [Bdellovibrionales bacterium]|nr:SdpI family protein [Bdellovibrionales bacterium]